VLAIAQEAAIILGVGVTGKNTATLIHDCHQEVARMEAGSLLRKTEVIKSELGLRGTMLAVATIEVSAQTQNTSSMYNDAITMMPRRSVRTQPQLTRTRTSPHRSPGATASSYPSAGAHWRSWRSVTLRTGTSSLPRMVSARGSTTTGPRHARTRGASFSHSRHVKFVIDYGRGSGPPSHRSSHSSPRQTCIRL
jgi:hypothetical protein